MGMADQYRLVKSCVISSDSEKSFANDTPACKAEMQSVKDFSLVPRSK